MKRIAYVVAALFVSLSFVSNAQQFWIENWTGTTCASLCTTYTGPNGAWTNVPTGLNGAAANTWFFSYTEQGMGRTVCGSGTGTAATAHIGNVSNSPAAFLFCPTGDCGAAYDASSGAPSVRSNQRIESPVINCSGKSTITLSFNYIMDGEAAHDYATVWYYDGTAWALLASPAKTVNTGCGGQGKWTYYSVALPVSANNNANVQIGFNWQNDTDNRGTDPSFAVDSIVLSGAGGPPPPVTAFSVNDTLVCVGDSIQFTDLSTNSPTSWNWTFTGGHPPTSILQNPKVVYNAPGYYTVKLKSTNGGGSDSLTKTNYIHVVARPVIIFSGKDSVCACDTITITATGGGNYSWFNGATTSTITVNPCTTSCYSVSVSNGVCSTDSCFKVTVVPFPATVTLDLTFNGKDIDTLCQSFQVQTLGGGLPAGGVYTGSHVIGPGGTEFLPDSAGMYIITYTDSTRFGCKKSATDTVYVVVCTGVENIGDNNAVSLYPNPANNLLSLEVNEKVTGNVGVIITDVTGRVVSNQKDMNLIEGKTMSLNISGIASGIYFMEVTAGQVQYYAKFIKQ